MPFATRRLFACISTVALVCCIAPQLAHAGGASAGVRSPNPSMEQQLLDNVNAVRAQHGLPTLVADPTLTAVARQRDDYMLDQGVFTHCLDGALTCTVDRLALPTALRAAGLPLSGAAENLALDDAQGQQAVDDVVSMWLGSDGHRPSLLNPDFRTTGLGVVCCGAVSAYGSPYQHALVVTQVFEKAAPGDASPPNALADDGPLGVESGGSPCRFVLGFKAFRDLDPTDVGACLDMEAHDPATGDAVQHTSGGVLVWRKADDRIAFTNGSWTWVAGPHGLGRRRNDERFAWEPNPGGLQVIASTGSN